MVLQKEPNIKIDVKVQDEQVEVDCRAHQLTKYQYQNQGKYCRAKPDHNNARLEEKVPKVVKEEPRETNSISDGDPCLHSARRAQVRRKSPERPRQCRRLQWPQRFTAEQHRAPC